VASDLARDSIRWRIAQANIDARDRSIPTHKYRNRGGDIRGAGIERLWYGRRKATGAGRHWGSTSTRIDQLAGNRADDVLPGGKPEQPILALVVRGLLNNGLKNREACLVHNRMRLYRDSGLRLARAVGDAPGDDGATCH
jgi:hypothetical protein